MHILTLIAVSDLKVELIQPHSGSPVYIELLKIFLAWPVVILVIFSLVLYKSGDSLKKFLANISEFTFKAGGVEASAKRHQIDAAALLGAASVRQLVGATDQQQTPDEAKVREVAQAVSEATQPSVPRRFGQASILWVDDKPIALQLASLNCGRFRIARCNTLVTWPTDTPDKDSFSPRYLLRAFHYEDEF